jgi:hypothetical protein
MGNVQSSEHRHFIQLLVCLLKSKGISYTQGQNEGFIETVIQFNPWFPEHGNLDPGSWEADKRKCKESSPKRGKYSYPIFWYMVLYSLLLGTSNRSF